jgi:uncharacterized protein (DUF433 family)
MVMRLYPHIVSDSNILAGQPVIEGTTIPVSLLITRAAEGAPLDTIASEMGVTLEEVRASLNYAAQRASEPVEIPDAAPENAPLAEEAEKQAIEREARQLGLAPEELTPLVRRLLALRTKRVASGEPPLTSWDEVAAEVAERRGGEYDEFPDSVQ